MSSATRSSSLDQPEKVDEERSARPLARRLADRIARLSLVVASGIFLVLLLVVMASTATRWGIPGQMTGSDEISGWLLAALTFCGFAHSLQAGAFIRVGVVMERLPNVWRRRVDMLGITLSTAFMAVVTYQIFAEWWDVLWRGSTVTGIYQVRTAIVRAPVLAGAVLLTLQLVLALLTCAGETPSTRRSWRSEPGSEAETP